MSAFFFYRAVITAIVLIEGPGDANAPVSWVRGARRAATRDLLGQLLAQDPISRIILVSPDITELSLSERVLHIKSEPGQIHVGKLLASIVDRHNLDKLLYLGGASCPLLTDSTLQEIITNLEQNDRILITNNQFASDWAAAAPATVLFDWVEHLSKDNMLGWVLSESAGLPLYCLPPATAEFRLDIDTPIDLLTLKLNKQTKSHLREYLATLPLDTSRLEKALAVLRRPASHVFVGGRFGPEAWRALNKTTQSWLRIVSEERGMLSSGRLARGVVYSLLGAYIEVVGVENFFSELAGWVDAAFIDSRVLMAHHGAWPSEADRFSSDLGFIEKITDPWLRTLTRAATECPIPVVLGGHGLMAGDMFAFCDLV